MNVTPEVVLAGLALLIVLFALLLLGLTRLDRVRSDRARDASTANLLRMRAELGLVHASAGARREVAGRYSPGRGRTGR